MATKPGQVVTSELAPFLEHQPECEGVLLDIERLDEEGDTNLPQLPYRAGSSNASCVVVGAADVYSSGDTRRVVREAAIRQCQWLLGACSQPASRFPRRGKR